MSCNLFLCIVDAIKYHDTYFEQRIDALLDLNYLLCKKLTLCLECWHTVC
ncbi:hypothetical protein RDI58_012784 [Solanum bulbocastanum]|uniref:Uncharacterized protein n=1 Tax=Solanum bulbocastanum TaxID=147425 RepID=A0AAN8TKX4_SOLBU